MKFMKPNYTLHYSKVIFTTLICIVKNIARECDAYISSTLVIVTMANASTNLQAVSSYNKVLRIVRLWCDPDVSHTKENVRQNFKVNTFSPLSRTDVASNLLAILDIRIACNRSFNMLYILLAIL